jgi:transcriptional regulator with XRE-family HTH domain
MITDKSLNLGEKIKNFRKRAGLSQFELETRIDASPGSISRIESGQINPTKETLVKIIESLDLRTFDAAQLFELDIQELPKMVEFAKNVSSKLSIDQVLQTSVNEIVNALNLLGSVIFLADSKKVYAKTFTQSWYTRLVLELIPIPFDKLSTSLTDNKENYVVKSIVEQQPYVSNRLSDFTKGVLPDKIADLCQKVSGHMSAISYPIVSEGKCIGAIMFTKKYIDDFKEERTVFKAFTDHIAVALSNAKKYEELKGEIRKLRGET